MPKVSVIMPSLNVVQYIRECMDSVVSQTLKDMEILCVDAGSTDGTWEILEEYAKADERVRLIKSPEKSYGYQMNLGMKQAEGEYIGIVETDDFIRPEMYEDLYAYAVKNDADFVKSDFDLFTTFAGGERGFLKYSMGKYTDVRYHTVFTAEDYISSKRTIDIFIWNGIYRRKFLEENHIRFQETPGAAFQDCGFRYQVALKVKRGFFVDGSYYRYRRDNAGSSTYNNRTVLFNLAECKNLLKTVRDAGGPGREQMCFLAREMALIALAPYTELLMRGEPAEGTREALEEFRGILKGFMKDGLLNQLMVTPDRWLETRMFVEQPEIYDYYVRLKAEAAAGNIRTFLKAVSEKKEVVLFGSGFFGSCAYCLLKNNGIHNVVAFCDNDAKKWGIRHMGCPVGAPGETVRKFPEAYFIIANAAHQGEMRTQLRSYGVPGRQTAVYDVSASPMTCTDTAVSF